MALWMVRCGKYGEREAVNLEHSVVSIDWTDLPDLNTVPDRPSLAKIMAENLPDAKPSSITNWAGQIWTFAKVMQVGDLVAMPLKSSASIQFGNITSDYEYMPEFGGAQHSRKVQWLKSIPRSSIDTDLLFSFGAIMTVCNISRNDAEKRIRALIGGGPVAKAGSTNLDDASASDPKDGVAGSEFVDFDELLLDQIRTHIAQKFAGHALAELVEAVLKAQGFKTYLSPPGPDGGVDVLAGLGPHGFDGTKLAVQVKSGSIEVDTNTFRQFRGVMKNFDANHGLIVSWGGFKTPVQREIPREYFNVRFWSADELIAAILRHYEALPAKIQARLPLKQTWMLVVGDDD